MKMLTNIHQLLCFTKTWEGPIALDTETHPEHLLGISISNGKDAAYIPIQHYNKSTTKFDWVWEDQSIEEIAEFFSKKDLIGHNFTYDKQILNKYWCIDTNWIFDTRIGWHLASAPSGPRPYSLKTMQVDLLGWSERGDIELKENVEKYGGKLKNGDHYLADLSVLAKYACLDALSTAQGYAKLMPFFRENEYMWIMRQMMDYNILLQSNTEYGILVDREGLQKAHNKLLKIKEAAKKRFSKELKDEIEDLEREWADRRIAEYKRQYNKDRYERHPEEWRRFNLNSDKDKRELFYEKLGHPVQYTTESGKPSVDSDSIKRMPGDFVEAYLKYENSNTLISNFSTGYLEASGSDSRLHPGFNICGTVSYRLSGFKPYLLNAPFDEKSLLKNFKCEPGWVGVHADLSAIEPTITAHYSEDTVLLKVFSDGLGDIYLDLAKELFPRDEALQNGYNGNIPATKEIKERFAKQRKIAKVIQLAVQYTGTGHTVSRNLTRDGIETTKETADNYVRAYWRKFRKVAEMNYRLKELNRQQGYLRNVIGRIIRVPDPEYKDLSNRFIQSSAHDVLVLWVLEIYRLAKESGIEVKPVLLDCHDSTSNQCPIEQKERLLAVYKEALANINSKLGLCVTVRAEYKYFNSLAGLKGEEK